MLPDALSQRLEQLVGTRYMVDRGRVRHVGRFVSWIFGWHNYFFTSIVLSIEL